MTVYIIGLPNNLPWILSGCRWWWLTNPRISSYPMMENDTKKLEQNTRLW